MSDLVTICVPLTWQSVPAQFHMSFTRMLFTAMRKAEADNIRINVEYDAVNYPVDNNRNNLVEIALAKKSDYILFIDADQTFPTDMMSKLMAGIRDTKAGIYSGTYFHKQYPYACVNKTDGEKNGYYIGLQEGNPDRPVKRAYPTLVGMGCALIDCKVFDKVKPPYFEYSFHPEINRVVSEDVSFCRKVTEAGFLIVNDWNIQSGHLRYEAFGIEHHRALRALAEYLNDEAKSPTLLERIFSPVKKILGYLDRKVA